MKTIAIQGDLRIVKIDALPKTAKKREGKVLIYGESTGNMHAISDGEVYELRDRFFFSTPMPTTITHQEHFDIEVGEGVYEIKRQREYSGKDMTRLVVD